MSYSSEVLADSPLAYYRLGEASGTTAADSSGNARDGTYNGPTLGATSLLTGDADTAASFDGVDDYVLVSYGSWMDTTAALTVDAWIKPSAISGTHIIASRYGAQWAFMVESNKVAAYLWDSGNNFHYLAGATTLVTGTTYHVALVVDTVADTAKVYLNGVQDGSIAFTAAALQSGAGSSVAMRLGMAGSGSLRFTGVIDDVAMYSTALSSTRIAAHHTAGTTTPPPPGATGTISALLPPLSANLSGGIEFSGTITATLPALGADLSGTSLPPGVAGTLSATLPPLGGSLTGAYSDTGTLAAVLPPLSASLTGTYGPAGTLDATLPNLAANLSGTSVAPGVSGVLSAILPALSASLSGHVIGRAGFGLALDSSATVTVDAALDATITSTTVPLHVVTPTVPVPTLVAGRPS